MLFVDEFKDLFGDFSKAVNILSNLSSVSIGCYYLYF